MSHPPARRGLRQVPPWVRQKAPRLSKPWPRFSGVFRRADRNTGARRREDEPPRFLRPDRAGVIHADAGCRLYHGSRYAHPAVFQPESAAGFGRRTVEAAIDLELLGDPAWAVHAFHSANEDRGGPILRTHDE